MALGLAISGFQVALVARNGNQLKKVSDSIQAQGGRAVWMAADISQSNEVEGVHSAVERELGVPTLLVNAAGTFGPLCLIRNNDPEHWIQTLNTNTIGPFLMCRAFVGEMIDQGWGRIINLSSAASLAAPGPLNSAYAVSKVALNHFTRSLAAELAGTGVTANVIHPGEVQTDMWAEIRDLSEKNPTAIGFRQWVQWVQETGGDPPSKTLELILYLYSMQADAINGQFLWIKDGLQPPLPSW